MFIILLNILNLYYKHHAVRAHVCLCDNNLRKHSTALPNQANAGTPRNKRAVLRVSFLAAESYQLNNDFRSELQISARTKGCFYPSSSQQLGREMCWIWEELIRVIHSHLTFRDRALLTATILQTRAPNKSTPYTVLLNTYMKVHTNTPKRYITCSPASSEQAFWGNYAIKGAVDSAQSMLGTDCYLTGGTHQSRDTSVLREASVVRVCLWSILVDVRRSLFLVWLCRSEMCVVVAGTYCTDLEDWDLNLLNSPGAVHSVPSCNTQDRRHRSESDGGREQERGRERAHKCMRTAYEILLLRN